LRLAISSKLCEEIADAASDLVSCGSDLRDRATLGVGEVPIDVALARDVWALVAAAHRHDDVCLFSELAGE
jgi:hypothetical protein